MCVWFFQGKDEHFDDAATVRREVFVTEQGCDADNEQDVLDETAYHVVLRQKDPIMPYATGRLFEQDGAWHIGRVAVLPSFRKRGAGQRVMLLLIEEAQKERPEWDIILHAQLHARNFYEKMGFVCEGGEFFEEGIAHCAMCLRPEAARQILQSGE